MVKMQTIAALVESRCRTQACRRLRNCAVLTLSMATTAFGLFWLVWILMSTVTRDADGMSLALSTEMTPSSDVEGGGLANAPASSGLLILWATVFGTPPGIMTEIYLAEYGHESWLVEMIRFINDILFLAPSAVVGLLVCIIVMVQMKHLSGWVGVIALTLSQMSIVTRITENMLKPVPGSLREAVYTLSTPKWKMTAAVTPKASMSGIVTGILPMTARIADEITPLSFTASSDQLWSTNIVQPIANLSATILKSAVSPFTEWQQLAWAKVLIITLCVLLPNILARVVSTENKHGQHFAGCGVSALSGLR